MKKQMFLVSVAVVALLCGCCKQNTSEVTTDYPELDQLVTYCRQLHPNAFGYPVNQRSALHEFYKWYVSTGLDTINMNNVGDPWGKSSYLLGTHSFEVEVMEFFGPLYGFEKDNLWGIVTNSGTDGNNHGIYFGTNVLQMQTGKLPIVYVSDEAHYSNARLCDLQNLDLRLIKTDSMGRMLPEDLEKQLDPKRPCLIVYAMGSTFRGAIDDMEALNAVLAKYPEMPVYRHVDAALFGGYLPFTQYKDMVNSRKMNFQSISVSGHKFFGIDSPTGLFITTREIYDNQSSYDIPYLNADMKMISCSRDAVQALKFWWLIKHVGADQWKEQATAMLECTQYMKSEMDKIGWPCWANEYSNTVFFRRPSQAVVDKYSLASGYNELFGGDLAHVVVMQHVTHEAIDRFIEDLKKECK
ncbi:MAG: aminotransferase class V-fold PLP-dependent enzyme [Paludibacteraceae bacterium]|nr:aminotransferase class V-fold PLP-dependent enzyme [Paludibacteraceae bacterium]